MQWGKLSATTILVVQLRLSEVHLLGRAGLGIQAQNGNSDLPRHQGPARAPVAHTSARIRHTRLRADKGMVTGKDWLWGSFSVFMQRVKPLSSTYPRYLQAKTQLSQFCPVVTTDLPSLSFLPISHTSAPAIAFQSS